MSRACDITVAGEVHPSSHSVQTHARHELFEKRRHAEGRKRWQRPELVVSGFGARPFISAFFVLLLLVGLATLMPA